jgi:drug/metabolite transporter (DMT)-like permease
VTPSQLAQLVAIAALWGASFLFIRVAAPVLGPVALIDARMALAGAVLLAIAAASGRMPRRAQSGRFAVLGALWAAPFTLIAVAELHLTASLTSVLNATTPMFSALVAAVWLGDRLTARKVAGLALGVAGVVLVVGWNPIALSAPVVLSAGATVLAALLYGIGGVYGARAFAGVPGVTVAAGQQIAGAVLLAPLLLADRPRGPLTTHAALSVLGLALASTALGFVLFFRLVAQLGPTGALTVTYLVPVFGVLWGALFLDEPVAWSLLGGLAVVLASIALITQTGRASWSASAAGGGRRGSGARSSKLATRTPSSRTGRGGA